MKYLFRALFATLAILVLAASSFGDISNTETLGAALGTQILTMDGLQVTSKTLESQTRPLAVHDNDIFYYDLPHMERSLKDYNLRLRIYASQVTFDLGGFIFHLKDLEKELLDFQRGAARGSPSKNITSSLELGSYLFESLSQFARAMLPYHAVGTASGNHIYAMMELKIKTLALQSAPGILDNRILRYEERILGLWRSVNFANTQFGRLAKVSAEERKVFKNEFSFTRCTIKALGKQIESHVRSEFLSVDEI
ncbi:hypothetical protein OXX79_006397 [Metschnikowia pulcherrima]